MHESGRIFNSIKIGSQKVDLSTPKPTIDQTDYFSIRNFVSVWTTVPANYRIFEVIKYERSR